MIPYAGSFGGFMPYRMGGGARQPVSILISRQLGAAIDANVVRSRADVRAEWVWARRRRSGSLASFGLTRVSCDLGGGR